jgi:hypothetical protein
MLPVNRPIYNLRLAADIGNSNPAEKNSSVNPDVINLENRIEQNRPLIEHLKTDREFQNTLTLLRKEFLPTRQLLDFLTGNASLEECVMTIEADFNPSGGERYTTIDEFMAGKKWIIEVLVRTFKGLKVKSSLFGTDTHFLPKPLTDPLAAIFRHGYLESDEKTYSKMNALMQAIESSKLDLSGADLSDINFDYANLADANLAGANLGGASTIGTNFINANLLEVIWESENVKLAGQEIDRALFMIEGGQPDKVIGILEAVYKNTKSAYSGYSSDRQLIMDKIFEAALEVALAGHRETALSILRIPANTGTSRDRYGRYNWESQTCLSFLEDRYFSLDYSADSLKEGILKKRNLKCAPYFLSRIYETSIIERNDINAKKFLEIAVERGYEPVAQRKQRKEYQLMLEARQSNDSVFSHFPKELVEKITGLRIDATLAQSEFDKMLRWL